MHDLRVSTVGPSTLARLEGMIIEPRQDGDPQEAEAERERQTNLSPTGEEESEDQRQRNGKDDQVRGDVETGARQREIDQAGTVALGGFAQGQGADEARQTVGHRHHGSCADDCAEGAGDGEDPQVAQQD